MDIFTEILRSTPGGYLGLASAIAILILSIAGSLIAVAKSVGGTDKHEGCASVTITALSSFCGKFREIRTTAVIFGVMLTIITIVLTQSFDNLAEAKEAFWLALGVVLGGLATAIMKLSDDNGRDGGN